MLISSWLIAVTNKIASLVIGVWSVLLIAGLLALGWFGWRPLFRWVELSFWSLNSIVVEPAYAPAARRCGMSPSGSSRAASVMSGEANCGPPRLLLPAFWFSCWRRS
jgi:hypothetical protein